MELVPAGKIESKSEEAFSTKTFHLALKIEDLSERDFNIVDNMIELMVKQ